jgi:nucleolar protein 56
LKKGVKPPKYGVIFSDKRIRGADRDKRGKVARKIAAKLSVAAKVDYFKGEFIGQKLSDDLDEDMKRL